MSAAQHGRWAGFSGLVLGPAGAFRLTVSEQQVACTARAGGPVDGEESPSAAAGSCGNPVAQSGQAELGESRPTVRSLRTIRSEGLDSSRSRRKSANNPNPTFVQSRIAVHSCGMARTRLRVARPRRRAPAHRPRPRLHSRPPSSGHRRHPTARPPAVRATSRPPVVTRRASSFGHRRCPTARPLAVPAAHRPPVVTRRASSFGHRRCPTARPLAVPAAHRPAAPADRPSAPCRWVAARRPSPVARRPSAVGHWSSVAVKARFAGVGEGVRVAAAARRGGGIVRSWSGG